MDNSAVHTGDILVVDDTLANLRLVNIQPTHLLLQKSRHCPAKAAIK
jgi:hypothetical protein